MDSPEGLRYKLLDLLGLINAEAESRSLAWPVGEHPDPSLCSGFGESVGLKPGKGNTYLEIQHLSSIDRDGLIEVGLVSQVLKGQPDVLDSNRRELGSIDSLHFPGLRDVLLAEIENLEADVLTFFVTVKPEHHEVEPRRHSL